MLVNPSPIRRFHWHEPFAFSRARAAVEAEGGNLRLTAILWVLLAATMLVAGSPTSVTDAGVVAIISTVGALCVSHVLLPLCSRIPNSVSVMTDSFVVGRERISFFDVEHAVVGTTSMRGRVFPVLSFRTRSGQNFLFGLSRKVDSRELADFFERVGIREPRDGSFELDSE